VPESDPGHFDARHHLLGSHVARKRKLGLSRDVATGKDCPFGAIRFGCTTRDQRVDISRRRSEIRSALAPLALTYASDARHRHATAAMLGGFTGRHFFTILVLLIDSACASMRPRRFSRGKPRRPGAC